jgi:GTP-binding protein EngB required for normal cell division
MILDTFIISLLVYQMPKSRTIHVLILGDSGVGKTTFITTLFSEVSYPTENVLQPVLLPPNMCISSPDIYTELIDSDANHTNLPEAISKSDIILLMYDISDQETIDRISTYSHIPVIVVGNKLDKIEFEIRSSNDSKSIKDVVKGLSKEFNQVQMGLECSAYDKKIVSILQDLQVTVLYPLGPLYNLRERDLSVKFRKILTRIFRILDEDTDGQLSD